MIEVTPVRSARMAVRACQAAYGGPPPDGWVAERRSWRNTQAVSLRRPGETTIAYAGTNGSADWGDNLRARQVKSPRLLPRGRVHRGMLRHYERSASWLIEQIDDARDRGDVVEITGHSLGGDAAMLAALEARRLGVFARVTTLGSPRLYSPRAASYYDSEIGQLTTRVVTVDRDGRHDIVPRIPPRWSMLWLYRHVGHVLVAYPDRVEFGGPAWSALRGLRPAVWPWQLGRVIASIGGGRRCHGIDVYATNLGVR